MSLAAIETGTPNAGSSKFKNAILAPHLLPATCVTTPTPPRPLMEQQLNHDETPTTVATTSTNYYSQSQTAPENQTPKSKEIISQTPPTLSKHGHFVHSHRLLYRGALSLPDSMLLLDGITFAARLDSPSKHGAFNLLENPLALALESMRGRPTLRFLGTVHLKDVYLDESGGVIMDIHPCAAVSRIYFENIFCLSPFAEGTPRRSDIGVRVALGDSDGPETTYIVIFAQTTSSSSITTTIQLQVARIAPRPQMTDPKKRIPRPDDPIPRKPPPTFGRGLERSGSIRDLKRMASGSALSIGDPKRPKLAAHGANGIVADLGSGVRLGGAPAGDACFKVPELPLKTKIQSAVQKGKGKERENEVEDVFGDVVEVEPVDRVAPTGKQVTNEGQSSGENKDEANMEKANKNAIRKTTTEYLGRTKDPTDYTRFMDKTHPDFKELYGFIYRGVCYALRARIRTRNLDLRVVNRLVESHALMYLGGCGGSVGLLCAEESAVATLR